MSTQRLSTPAPIVLTVSNGSGSVQVTAADTDETVVEITPGDTGKGSERAAADTVVDLSTDGGELEISVPSRHGRSGVVDITVTVPADSSLRSRAGSADLRATGRIGGLNAKSGSGDVSVADIRGDADTATGSGDIRLGGVSGAVSCKTGSGDLWLATPAGRVQASSGSGDVHIGSAVDVVSVRVASGDVTVDGVGAGRTDVTSASGDVRIGVAAGTVARLDVSTVTGHVSSQLPVEDEAPADGPTAEVRARTVSGDVLITSAAAQRS